MARDDAKFALDCRKIRMIIANRPGIKDRKIKEEAGFNPESHLSRMEDMGIILQANNGGWTVIPQ